MLTPVLIVINDLQAVAQTDSILVDRRSYHKNYRSSGWSVPVFHVVTNITGKTIHAMLAIRNGGMAADLITLLESR